MAFLAGVVAGIVVGAGIAYWRIDPVGKMNLAQAAIVGEYVRVNCHPQSFVSRDPMFLSGNAAALSRLTVDAALGEVALAEYAKCKVKSAF